MVPIDIHDGNRGSVPARLLPGVRGCAPGPGGPARSLPSSILRPNGSQFSVDEAENPFGFVSKATSRCSISLPQESPAISLVHLSRKRNDSSPSGSSQTSKMMLAPILIHGVNLTCLPVPRLKQWDRGCPILCIFFYYVIPVLCYTRISLNSQMILLKLGLLNYVYNPPSTCEPSSSARWILSLPQSVQ